MPISRIGTDGIDQTSSQQIGGISVGRGGGAVATNTAVGTSALPVNTSGAYNVSVGQYTLQVNTSGSNNTALGWGVMGSNTTGSYNTALGGQDASTYPPLFSNTTGAYNVGVGNGALAKNTTASNNTAVGYQAGYSQTTTGYGTFLGQTAGYSTTGISNTFVGQQAGALVTSGAKNTIIGRYDGNQGGLDIRTGSNWIVLSDGDGTPRGYTNGPQAWVVNSASGYRYSEFDFNIGNVYKAAFYWDDTLARFYVSTSAAAVYISNGGTSWTSASDERAKDIIAPITDAANKVSQLRAVIGKYKTDADGTRRSFLIAQDVLAVLPEAVSVPSADATEKDGSPAMMGVEYTSVIPLLVAAIKELKAEFDAYKEAHP